jgi:hypothetical protein
VNWFNVFLLTFVLLLPTAFMVFYLILLPRNSKLRAKVPDTEPAKESMPIDPANPPSWKVYSPRKGAPGRACACHPDRALQPGQRVLWWPVPVSGGGVNVFCQDGVEQVNQ